MPLTELQEEVLTGLMLGDGHLSIGGRSINPRLRINRAVKDLDYAKWIAEVFKNYCSHNSLKIRTVYDYRYEKEYTRVSFCTRRNQDFTPTYKLWYGGHDKCLPAVIKLTPIMVAVWFADDGSLHAKRRNGFSSGTELKLASCSFGKEGSERLAALLNERYGGGFSVYGGYRTEASKHYRIMASTKPARRLLLDIDPVFPDLERKSDFWRCGKIDLHTTSAPTCPTCGSERTYRNGIYIGATTSKQRLKCSACNFAWKIQIPKRL